MQNQPIKTNHHDSRKINYDLNSKVMLIAVFSLCFVILLVILLHLYARYALRHPWRRPATFIHHYDHYLEPPHPKPGLDPTVIMLLPSFPFKQLSDNDGLDQTECAVCLSMLEDGEMARQLPNCNHIFHLECIDRWLSNQATCPICRSDPTSRLDPLPQEPPHGSELEAVMVVASEGDNTRHDSTTKASNGNVGASSSLSTSSFRLSSFRKMIGRDRSSSSSSSRIFQVQEECDFEREEIQ
ncbi:hypothetical protein Cgig2_012279 [Carnegiea gigantea]|uniref:RING-type E3 ubiquitin transferase n=1 Tax=Carnegiea gigantea TaxID=171969 RepID=A0A9Q1K375_9CARY|nr:hypothetical protein Cgig2_012279 [Carnegiea gigantea]